MKNTALKYTMLLIEFFILSVFIHFITSLNDFWGWSIKINNVILLISEPH